jgi:hypothetical protein
MERNTNLVAGPAKGYARRPQQVIGRAMNHVDHHERARPSRCFGERKVNQFAVAGAARQHLVIASRRPFDEDLLATAHARLVFHER